MNRRNIIKTLPTLLVAPALVGLSRKSLGQEQRIVLKFHTFMSTQSFIWKNILTPWMEKVTHDSNGLIQFEAYPAMQLGGTPASLITQVKEGIVDIVWTLPSYTSGSFPRMEVFELPFMMTNAQATSQALWDYIQTVGHEDFSDVQVLAVNVHGPGTIHTSKKAIYDVTDLKGLKIRAPSRQSAKLLAALGATPLGLPLPSIADALSKGSITGALLPWDVVPSIKVQELTKFHTELDPSMNALYTSSLALIMNRKRYRSLTGAVKATIDKNSGRNVSGWFGLTQSKSDSLGRESAKKQGNTIIVLNQEKSLAFKKQTASVTEQWISETTAQGIDAKSLLTSAHRLIEQHSQMLALSQSRSLDTAVHHAPLQKQQ